MAEEEAAYNRRQNIKSRNIGPIRLLFRLLEALRNNNLIFRANNMGFNVHQNGTENKEKI